MQQAGDAEGAAKKKTSRRTWLLRIGAVLLALGFVSPSCITIGVWEEDRQLHHIASTEHTGLDVFPARDADGRFLIRLPATQANDYVELPASATDPIWLQVTPLRHGETVATLMALEATLRKPQRSGAKAARPEPADLRLVRVDGADGKAREWTLDCDLWPGLEVDGRLVRKLPGFRTRVGIYPSSRFLTPCTVEVLATPPLDPGTPGHHADLMRGKEVDSGTPWIVRASMTPFSLLADAVTAPIQLLFTL